MNTTLGAANILGSYLVPGPGLWVGAERNLTWYSPKGPWGGWDGAERTCTRGTAVLAAPSGVPGTHSCSQASSGLTEPSLHGCRLAIQVEENEMLRAALGGALRGKEEDFRMYHETLAQVKGIFLQALRQQKADKH